MEYERLAKEHERVSAHNQTMFLKARGAIEAISQLIAGSNDKEGELDGKL